MGMGANGPDTFWPDDTNESFYLTYDEKIGLTDLIAEAQMKWPGIRTEDLEIAPRHIHTRCLGYDLYDPGDYTYFVRVDALPDYFQRQTKEGLSVTAPAIE